MTRVIKFNKEKIKKHFGEEQIKYLEFAKGLQRLILDCCDIEYTKEEQACK